jgi:hypothetical protein
MTLRVDGVYINNGGFTQALSRIVFYNMTNMLSLTRRIGSYGSLVSL